MENMLPECPRCHISASSSHAQYCARCGASMNRPAVKPIHLERAGSLLTVWFVASLLVVITGAVLASAGLMRGAGLALGVGVPALVITTIRSQGRKH